MEVSEFVKQISLKYGYSEELTRLLEKAVPSLISFYGEDKKELIFAALNECEIHIQAENENMEEYINKYFNDNQKRDLPFLTGAVQISDFSVENNEVKEKNLIYLKTVSMGFYTPFDFNDNEKVSGVIHEICHLIKGYNNHKIENGQIINCTGLLKEYLKYDEESKSYKEIKTENVGLEEALNSYDEAEVMTIMTGEKHELGGYKAMTHPARALMQNEEIAQAIRESQFIGNDKWIEFFGKEKAEFLAKSFDDWVNAMYVSPMELLKNREKILKQVKEAATNIYEFVTYYNNVEDKDKSK